MRLPDHIRRLVEEDPPRDPVEIAEQLLDSADRQQLVAMIAEEVEHMQRSIARSKELRAFGAWRPEQPAEPTLVVAPTRVVPEAFRALFETEFALGDGTVASWGKATTAQHEARLSMLLKLRDGLDRTIERHQWAIQTLRETGARCLDQLDHQQTLSA